MTLYLPVEQNFIGGLLFRGWLNNINSTNWRFWPFASLCFVLCLFLWTNTYKSLSFRDLGNTKTITTNPINFCTAQLHTHSVLHTKCLPVVDGRIAHVPLNVVSRALVKPSLFGTLKTGHLKNYPLIKEITERWKVNSS